MISKDLWKSIEDFFQLTIKEKQFQQSNLYKWRLSILKDRWKREYHRVRCPIKEWVILESLRSSRIKIKHRLPKQNISGILSSGERNQEAATSQRRLNTNLWVKVSSMLQVEQSILTKLRNHLILRTMSLNLIRLRLQW